MAFDHQYPYTDFHELNLDWVLSKVTEIDDRFNTIEENIRQLQEDLQTQTERIDVCLDHINDIEAQYPLMICSEYDESRTYDPGELCRYQNKIYKAKPGQTPGPFNDNDWIETNLGDELGTLIYSYNEIVTPAISNINDNISDLYHLYDIIGEEYDPTKTYYRGNMCIYENAEYICTASSTTGTFDPSKWYAQNINTRLGYIETNTGMIVALRDMIAPDWDSESTYNEGDYVLLNDKLYRALQAVPVNQDPQLSPAYWTNVTIGSELHTIRFMAFNSYFEKMQFTLTAGQTTISGVAPVFGEDSALQIFTSIFGVSPVNIAESLGIFTIEFPAQVVDMDVLVFAYPTT